MSLFETFINNLEEHLGSSSSSNEEREPERGDQSENSRLTDDEKVIANIAKSCHGVETKDIE